MRTVSLIYFKPMIFSYTPWNAGNFIEHKNRTLALNVSKCFSLKGMRYWCQINGANFDSFVYLFLEAATEGVLYKKGFLKISQYSQAILAILAYKHLCWSLFLIKLQAFRLNFLLKRDSRTGVFLWIFQNF